MPFTVPGFAGIQASLLSPRERAARGHVPELSDRRRVFARGIGEVELLRDGESPAVEVVRAERDDELGRAELEPGPRDVCTTRGSRR